jgi:FtsH-binding integral membrane protein
MPSPQIDPRGQQFAAAVTSLVLVAVLLTAPGPLGIALLAAQAALFATAVLRGVQRTPVAAVFRAVVRPRLAPPPHLEDPEPPRFAQGVGLVFALVALVGFLSGATTLGYVATGFALVAALLNATIGLCLGCEVYLLGRRALAVPQSSKIPATQTRSTP